MEKFAYQTLILLIILGAVILTGCTESPHEIVGTWEARYEYIEFHDGTRERNITTGYIQFNADNTGQFESQTFEWRDIGDGRIKYEDSYGEIDFNYEIRGELLFLSTELDKGTFTIEFVSVPDHS